MALLCSGVTLSFFDDLTKHLRILQRILRFCIMADLRLCSQTPRSVFGYAAFPVPHCYYRYPKHYQEAAACSSTADQGEHTGKNHEAANHHACHAELYPFCFEEG